MKAWKRRSIWTILALVAIFCFIAVVVIIYFELQLPTIQEIKNVRLQVPMRVFAKNGALIAEYGNQRRLPVDIKEIPQSVIDATLATEDQRYFSHPGIDILGLGRAAVVLVLTGRKEQGGSTITMQVARNYFLTRKKTYSRKLREILLALKIDHALSKNKVLELYFNKIFYGNHAYGIAAAAQIYYGKPLMQLTLAQASMLAGTPKAPSTLNPLANKVRAKDRRDHVLGRMLDEKLISQQQYQQAVSEPLTASYHGLKIGVVAPYVAETVRQEMLAEYGENAYSNGLNVYTTIDPVIQDDANQALFQGLLAYDKRHGYRGPEGTFGHTLPTDLSTWVASLNNIADVNRLQAAAVIKVDDDNRLVQAVLGNGNIINVYWPQMSWARKQFFKSKQEFLGVKPKIPSQILSLGDVIRVDFDNSQWELSQVPRSEAALVAMDPQSGGVLAMVGGFNYAHSQFNRVTQAYRQPGSSIKPFIYSAALAKGYTLASMINDAPVVIPTDRDDDLWRPENDTRKFYGPTSLQVALMQSRNLVSIRLLQMIGIPYTIEYLSRFGFDPQDFPHSLSLALGTAEVTPLQLTTGYCVFANTGYQVKSHLIDHMTDSDEKVIYQAQAPIVQAQALQATPTAHQSADDAEQNQSTAPRVITPQNAYLITHALKDVILYGTGRPAQVLKRNDLAGKTGTTNKKRDAWFSGYNNHLVATSWVGFDDPHSLYEYGNQAALPIWIDFMRLALKGKAADNVPQPPGIVSVRINPSNGQLAGPNDRNAIFGMFRSHNAPTSSGSESASLASDSGDSEQQIY